MTSDDEWASAYPRARKRFGQHFLSDPRILTRIVDALELTGSETVIEIGPGRGSLTSQLVERAGRLIAIELDRDLAGILRKRYASKPSVSIVEEDVLEVNLGELANGPYRLVGNVPYYITTPILFHGLRTPRAETSVYLVQKEVAERVVAPPGSKTYGALSVNVQALATPELLFRVPAGAFQPPPKVESAVLRITPRVEPLVSPALERRFRTLVQGAFALRRKQMRRVLRSLAALDAPDAEAILTECAIDPDARPETLSPEAFARLLHSLAAR